MQFFYLKTNKSQKHFYWFLKSGDHIVNSVIMVSIFDHNAEKFKNPIPVEFTMSL